MNLSWERRAEGLVNSLNLCNQGMGFFFPILSSVLPVISHHWVAQGISYQSVTVSEVTRVVIHLHESSLPHLSQNMQMQRTVRLFSGVKLCDRPQSMDTSPRASFPYSLNFINYFASGFCTACFCKMHLAFCCLLWPCCNFSVRSLMYCYYISKCVFVLVFLWEHSGVTPLSCRISSLVSTVLGIINIYTTNYLVYTHH